MAKKNGYYERDVIELCAYVALCLSGLLLLINWILGLLDGNLGSIMKVLAFIRDLAFLVGVGLAALKFTRGKSVAIKVIFWVAVVSYLVFAILNIL